MIAALERRFRENMPFYKEYYKKRADNCCGNVGNNEMD